MGFNEFLGKLLGNKSSRDMREIQPLVNTVKKAYEDIVEGNYIDNLIRKQKETKHLRMPT